MPISANSLTVEDLSLAYPRAKSQALHEVNFTLGASKILSVVGHSGSGKSSLLRAIAGLERPQKGQITLGETLLSGTGHFVRPDRRPLGLVSQSGDLFPHLTIARNVTYGLRRWSRSAKKDRCQELLKAVGLSGLEKRYPHQLSGGEAQRIALIRALAPRPSLLLLDEPFSNLDTMLRENLRRITTNLVRQEKTTALFVTHHPDDALAVGDEVAVMHQARIVQHATPREIWDNPASSEVAALFSGINDLSHLTDHQNLPSWLRADQITLCPESPDALANGTVSSVEYFGAQQQIFVDCGHSSEMKVMVTSNNQITIGDRVGIARK